MLGLSKRISNDWSDTDSAYQNWLRERAKNQCSPLYVKRDHRRKRECEMNNRVRKENPIFRSIWYKEKFISQFEEKRISVAGEQWTCSRVWIACFLNFKSHITRQVSLFSQAMAKQLIQDKRKLPQSFVLCIFLAFSAFFFFFKSYNFPENNPLSLSLCVCIRLSHMDGSHEDTLRWICWSIIFWKKEWRKYGE